MIYSEACKFSTLQPRNLAICNPATLQPYNPATLQPYNPTTLQPYNMEPCLETQHTK